MINPFRKYLTKEQLLQEACIRWLKMQYPEAVFTHPPNESKKTPFERFLYSIMGVRSGMNDILIFNPKKGFTGLAIELKMKGNTVSKNQKDCHEDLKRCGWCVLVVWDSSDNFRSVVNDYFRKF